MIICAPLILFIFLGIWVYGIITALRIRNYIKEIKELAATQNIVLPLYRENIYPKVSAAKDVGIFYVNWASMVKETDTSKSLKDKRRLLRYFKNGRKIKIFISFFIGYVIITSIAVLIKLMMT
jgi:hypothetical protein